MNRALLWGVLAAVLGGCGDIPINEREDRDTLMTADAGVPATDSRVISDPPIDSGAQSDTAVALPDTSVSPPSPNACAPGNYQFDTPGWSNNMATCQTTGADVSQCEANPVCNTAGGWHMCTATEYLTRGGKTAAGFTGAWIASCVRDGTTNGLIGAPSDVPCACTPPSPATAPGELYWRPDGSLLGSALDFGRVGIVAVASSRLRVGANTASYEAYWGPASVTALDGSTNPVRTPLVVCCN